MKVLVLLACVSLTAAQFDMFNMMEDGMSAGFQWIDSMINEHVLSEDGESFKPAVMAAMGVAQSQICPAESDQCSADESWLLGCNCRKAFRKLGECKKKPCELFTRVKENGPSSLNRFVNAQSYEERLQTMVDFLVEPMSRALCECDGMIGAAMTCVRKYDGRLFDLLGMDRTVFDSIVSGIDWKALKTMLYGFVDAGCGTKNGKDCVAEMSKMYTVWGTVLDNTFNGEDVCLSMIRFEEELQQFMMTMGMIDFENNSVKSAINQWVDAWVELEREVTCDADCADEISESFYSCCTKHALEVASSNKMRKAYKKVFKNVWSLVSESKVPDISGAMQKYLDIFDLEMFCEGRTDVYKLKNQQCDATNA